MWIKKTDEEYLQYSEQKKRQRYDYKRPLFVAVGLWSVGILFSVIGHGTRYTGWHLGVPINEVLSWLKVYFVPWFVLTFICLYLLQLAFGAIRIEGSNTVICDKCFKPCVKGKSIYCQCGGNLEPIERWKWVE